MQNVPKIVVNRLQSPPAESHPDADLLTAFAEQCLGGAERDHIVEHLARCGDCREVVSLALLPQVESQPLAEHPVNWFRWTPLRASALRWTAVAAGVVLLASIGALQYRRQQGRELASNVIETKPAIATPAQTQSASPEALPEAGVREDKLAPPRPQTDLAGNKPARSEGTVVLPRANSAVVSRGAIGGPIVRSGPGQVLNFAPRHDSVFGGTSAPPPAARQSRAPVPAPQTVVVGGAVQTVEAQSETVEVTAQSAPQSQVQDRLIQKETAEQSTDRVGKAKPASAQASLAMAPPSLHSEPILMNGLAAPRWNISASGALQRSFDGGQTWQEVNVAANDSALDRRQKAQTMTVEVQGDLTSEAQPDAQPEAKKQAKSREKDKQSAPVPTILRALSVSSNAAEVWAGGSGGVLYHTVDAGNSWSRVLPSAAGVNLTGDILSLQFSDPRNGTVTTSTAEVWTTPDAGHTWHKQP